MESKFEAGDVLKKDLRSRESWTVIEDSGKLRLQPNTNKCFTDSTIVDFDGEYTKLADIGGLDFSKEVCGWSEEALKYFTPSIEDIRVGYECECLWCCQEPRPWWPIVITEEDKMDTKSLPFGIEVTWRLQDGEIRVPYLTKEQIEAEGWEQRGGEWDFYKGKYHILYDARIKMLYMGMSGSKILDGARCKDINTFRMICKLLVT